MPSGASTAASARKSPELRTARFRRRKSNTSYAAGAAALDEAAAAAAGPVMGPDRSVDGDVLEERQFIQDLARSHDNGGERIVGQDHGQARLLAEKRVEIPEQRPATGQHDPLVDDVRRELGRRALETDTHGLDDLVDGLEQRVSDLLVRDLDGLRHTGHEVAALDLHGLELRAGIGRADGDLDQLGGPLADEQVVLPLDVLDDRLVHLVAADADRLGEHDARERDHGDLGGAAADVDHHVARRLGDGKPRADRGRHRLLDEVDLARAGGFGGLAHGSLLDLRDAERHADDDPGPHQGLPVVDLLDEVAEHRLGDLEVGDDAVLERPDRLDVAGRTAEHLLRLGPDRDDPPAAPGLLVHRHDRGLVADDSLALHVDEGVGR